MKITQVSDQMTSLTSLITSHIWEMTQVTWVTADIAHIQLWLHHIFLWWNDTDLLWSWWYTHTHLIPLHMSDEMTQVSCATDVITHISDHITQVWLYITDDIKQVSNGTSPMTSQTSDDTTCITSRPRPAPQRTDTECWSHNCQGLPAGLVLFLAHSDPWTWTCQCTGLWSFLKHTIHVGIRNKRCKLQHAFQKLLCVLACELKPF